MPESVLRFRVETADANRKVAKLEDQVRKLEIALKASGGTSRNAATGMKAFSQGAGAAGVSAKALGAAVKGILGPLSLVATAAGAVVTGFKGFVEADKARAAVRTLGVDVKTLEGQLVGVVARTGGLASTNELLAASYDVASAGFGKAADITKILEASLLGAVGGMTDINTVSDAATSVMNAFGLTTDSVSKIVDGFVQTQNDGKIVVGQYASQIGRVAPIAAAAGVGIDELNAAISTVTAQGVPVESTFSGINQVIASIVKPTAEAAKAAKRLGLDFNSAAIRTKGFGGFLEDVIQKTGGSEVEITKLFGSVDALKALMPLINDDLVTFNKNLDNQKNATGAAGDAADIMGQTVSSQISQIVNNITTLVRGLDQVLGPAIKGLLDLINSVLTAATAAVAKLTEMFQMNRARTQAREELGGVMGRGTVKADPAAIEARALEIFETQQAASAAAAAAATGTQPPANAILPTGNLTGGKKSELEQQQEAAAKLLKTLEERQTLATALTSDERRMLQLKIDQANVDEQFPKLSAETRQNIKDQLEALYAQEGVTKTLKKAAEDRSKAEKEAADKAEKEAKRLKDLYKKVGTAIENSIVDGIMGAIDGTQTLQETVSSLLKDISKMFLQFAVRGMLRSTGLPMFAAEGGYVSGATNAVVGEAGPEYIIPESKMRESMARYSRGARGSAVIPENGEGGTNSEGGGTALAAPIDVRFSVERINNVDYVTASEFQQGLQQAAAQGAQRGEQQTLRRLQMSSSTRRRIGV